MSDTDSTVPLSPDLTDLHAATCMLMTQFINGRHCPKLAHLIVHHLGCLLTHPQLEKLPNSRAMYQQLLEHWQNVTSLLLDQKPVQRQISQYH